VLTLALGQRNASASLPSILPARPSLAPVQQQMKIKPCSMERRNGDGEKIVG
jgi:hypothetical protein